MNPPGRLDCGAILYRRPDSSASFENLLGPGQVGLVDNDLGRRHGAVGARAQVRAAVEGLDPARLEEPDDHVRLLFVLTTVRVTTPIATNNALMPRYVALLRGI